MKPLPIELSTVRGMWAVSTDSASHSLILIFVLFCSPWQLLVHVRVLVPYCWPLLMPTSYDKRVLNAVDHDCFNLDVPHPFLEPLSPEIPPSLCSLHRFRYGTFFGRRYRISTLM
jgi:hypothetical protein